ncbi:MAG: hypothetical protein IPM47_09915 [Sphingobacteriales bacterium]|nr:MAG: hypothetical protein IPM47_09915 [Sphingobacteriales bacterium]
MKVLLEIKDNKANSLLEVLKSLPYVKIQPLTEAKAKTIGDIKKAVEELKMIQEGKLTGITIQDLLNEL